MTTPAESIDTTLTTPINLKTEYWFRGVNYVTTVDHPNRVSGYVRSIRPASTTSPVRNDGSRAPLPFDKRWAVYEGGKQSPLVVVRRLSSEEEYRYFMDYELSLYNGDPDRFASLVGIPYARVSSPGFFPYGVESVARTKALTKLRDQRMSLGETLAEARETVESLRSWSTGVLNAVETIARWKKRSKRDIVRIVKGIPAAAKRANYRKLFDKTGNAIIDRWLEFQYSVGPLLNDIRDGSAYLDYLVNDVQRTGKLSIKAGSSTTESFDVDVQSAEGQQIYTVTCVRDVACHISCVYTVETNTGYTLQQAGLTNSVAVAWELAPCSVIIDYGIGIGSWLQTLFPVEGATFLEGSISRKVEVVTASQATLKSSIYPVLVPGLTKVPFNYKIGRFKREILSNLAPALRPAFKSQIGLTQLANTLSVLTKLMG